MVQQHRIYVLQFDKGEPDQKELSCKVSPPKGTGRRIMYYYHDYGSGGGGAGAGKNGKPAKSRTLSLRGFFGLLLICFFCVVTLLSSPGAFFSFPRIGGVAAAAAATQQQQRAPCSGVMANDTLCCDRTSKRADMCFARGDMRMHSASKSFQLVSSSAAAREEEEERIRPYTRKWEDLARPIVDDTKTPCSATALARPTPRPCCDTLPRLTIFDAEETTTLYLRTRIYSKNDALRRENGAAAIV